MRTFALLILSALTCFGQGFSDASAPFLLSTSSLRKGLVGYWRLEEASGTRYDCSSYGNHLTSNNSVGQESGLQGNCAKLTASSSQYLSKTDNSLVRATGPWTFSAWVKFPSAPSGYGCVVGKWGPTYDYILNWEATGTKFIFYVKSNATNQSASVTQAISGGVWYHVLAYHDQVNQLIGLSVNNGTDSTNHADQVNGTSAAMCLGRNSDDGSITGYLTGSLDEASMWNRLLTTTERTQLYNSGLGTHFPFAHK